MSSPLFSVCAVKKRVHGVSRPRKVARDGISVAEGLVGDQLCGKPASQASKVVSCFLVVCENASEWKRLWYHLSRSADRLEVPAGSRTG